MVCPLSKGYAATDLPSIFSDGKVNGNIRAYYNTRDYQGKTDEAGFALGGALRAETAGWGESEWGKIGVGFYTAQDMGLNSDDVAEVNKRLGDELEVLGEAYLNLKYEKSQLTVGRQKFSTPFANPGDAFIVPMTFYGGGFSSQYFTDLTVQAGYLKEFKNRNSGEFVGVDDWIASRYGIASAKTEGTLLLGATYAKAGASVQGWYYGFDELFDMFFAEADYAVATDSSLKPFFGVQYGSQWETGDELLGKVDSSLIGLRAGLTIATVKVTLAYNGVDESTGAFKNGAFLAPFSFATSSLFTNSMLETVENTDSGDAIKLMLQFAIAKQTSVKLSYAELNFDTLPDREDIDIDITYQFEGALKGFSIRNRLTFVQSDVDSVEQINNRFQLQYAF